jgi:hypothetical protein
METVNLRLYEIFKQDFKLSDTRAKELTQAVEAVATEKATVTFENYKSSFREDFLKLEMKLERRITESKSELEIKIAESKADTIKWMFIFWAGQLAAMFGLLYFFIKK